MKKTVKMLALAAVASLTVVACNNNKPVEEEVDSTAIEMVAEEEIAAEAPDTVVAVAEEAVQTVKKTVKQAAKTEAKKVEVKVNEETQNLQEATTEKKIETPNQKKNDLLKRR